MTGTSVFSCTLALAAAWTCSAGSACAQAVNNAGAFATVPDYAKRAQSLDASVRLRLVGRWSNPVDRVVIEIASVDLASGQIRGTEWAQSGPAAGDAHELIGWVSVAPAKAGFDNVVPVTFSTTLYEYGTLPSWSGFLRDDEIITMHHLIWPNRTYAWDHISTFQETWTRMPTMTPGAR